MKQSFHHFPRPLSIGFPRSLSACLQIARLCAHPLLPKLGLELVAATQRERIIDEDIKPALLGLHPFKQGFHLKRKNRKKSYGTSDEKLVIGIAAAVVVGIVVGVVVVVLNLPSSPWIDTLIAQIA